MAFLQDLRNTFFQNLGNVKRGIAGFLGPEPKPEELSYEEQKKRAFERLTSEPSPTSIQRPTALQKNARNLTVSPPVQRTQFNLPPLTPKSPIYLGNRVSTESARPIVQKILQNYVPSGAPTPYQSPLLKELDTLSSVIGEYGLDPRLLPLLAISETGALRPDTRNRGYMANNPFAVVNPGSNPQTLFPYESVERAIRRYPEQYLFKRLPPNPTLQDFIGSQNPIDNPTGQLKLILQLARELGV